MRINIVFIIFAISISVGLFGEDFPFYGPFINLKRYNPEIIDARAVALGKSSILSSTGANYVFNNPAMLSSLSVKNIQLNGRALCGKDIYKLNDYIYDFEYPINLRFNGISFGMPLIIPNNLGFKLGLGTGYRTYYDLSNRSHMKKKNSDFEIDIIDRGGFSNIVIGGGICYQDKFLFGLSTSFPFLSNYSTETNGIDDSKIKNEGSMKGIFFTFSGSYIFIEKISLGARLRTGFNL